MLFNGSRAGAEEKVKIKSYGRFCIFGVELRGICRPSDREALDQLGERQRREFFGNHHAAIRSSSLH